MAAFGEYPEHIYPMSENRAEVLRLRDALRAANQRIRELEGASSSRAEVEQAVAERMALLDRVCQYADSVCGMLRQGGWPGKAEALESRIKAVIDFDASLAAAEAPNAEGKP